MVTILVLTFERFQQLLWIILFGNSLQSSDGFATVTLLNADVNVIRCENGSELCVSVRGSSSANEPGAQARATERFRQKADRLQLEYNRECTSD